MAHESLTASKYIQQKKTNNRNQRLHDWEEKHTMSNDNTSLLTDKHTKT